MKNLIILLTAIISLSSFNKNAPPEPKHKPVLKIVNFEQLQAVLHKTDNKLYVVNFWATWCKPCVHELPDFMEVNKIFDKNSRFKMILVDMDNALEIDAIVRPFIQKNKIKTDVYILDDNKRMNEWIPAVDNNWSGAIPATVFYRNRKKLDFRESSLTKKELEQLINKYL
jgi:Thioredoxin domain-containing protein